MIRLRGRCSSRVQDAGPNGIVKSKEIPFWSSAPHSPLLQLDSLDLLVTRPLPQWTSQQVKVLRTKQYKRTCSILFEYHKFRLLDQTFTPSIRTTRVSSNLINMKIFVCVVVFSILINSFVYGYGGGRMMGGGGGYGGGGMMKMGGGGGYGGGMGGGMGGYGGGMKKMGGGGYGGGGMMKMGGGGYGGGMGGGMGGYGGGMKSGGMSRGGYGGGMMKMGGGGYGGGGMMKYGGGMGGGKMMG